ncbi:MAG: hypothetical protein R3F19_11320 [Verrucomicrobiales bacterium]
MAPARECENERQQLRIGDALPQSRHEFLVIDGIEGTPDTLPISKTSPNKSGSFADTIR